MADLYKKSYLINMLKGGKKKSMELSKASQDRYPSTSDVYYSITLTSHVEEEDVRGEPLYPGFNLWLFIYISATDLIYGYLFTIQHD